MKIRLARITGVCCLQGIFLATMLGRQMHGTVSEDERFYSRILNDTVRFSIYLPPDYAASRIRYPVFYLLHGVTDDQTAWIQFGEANRTEDRGIADGTAAPCIIVMPAAKLTFYVNDFNGRYPYEDMFFNELIPHIDAAYRTLPRKEFRAVGGLSMGGYGALLYAMRHPDMFASCVAFSAAVWTDETIVAMDSADFERYHGVFYDSPHKAGKDRITPYWVEHNPLDIAGPATAERLRTVRWYIDCGDDDNLSKGNCQLHILFRDLKIPHEFRVHDGAHTWSYWRTYLHDGLEFISQTFHR